MLFQILKFFGFDFPIGGSGEVNHFVSFLCYIILLSVIIVICLLNVLFYFLIIYLLDDIRILDSYKDKLPGFVLAIIKLYKNTRKLFIVYEVCFALSVTFVVIWLCKLIIGFSISRFN